MVSIFTCLFKKSTRIYFRPVSVKIVPMQRFAACCWALRWRARAAADRQCQARILVLSHDSEARAHVFWLFCIKRRPPQIIQLNWSQRSSTKNMLSGGLVIIIRFEGKLCDIEPLDFEAKQMIFLINYESANSNEELFWKTFWENRVEAVHQ